MGGYVKIYRQMLDWEWYGDIPVKTLFLHLLLTVNFKPVKWHGIELEEGSRVTSLKGLAEETRLTVSQIRTAIKKLENTKEIACTMTNRYTIIKLVSYHKYQCVIASDITGESQTNRKQIATGEECKERKEKNIGADAPSISRSSKSKSRNKLSAEQINVHIAGLVQSQKVRDSLAAWVEMRLADSKRPFTLKAVELGVSKLRSFNYCEADAVRCINSTVLGGWSSFYPLKEDHHAG